MKPRLFKITLNAKLELDRLEAAVGEVPDIMKGEDEVFGVELQRIDIYERSTVVYLKGSEASAQAFLRCLRVAAPEASSALVKATAKDLHSMEDIRKS